MNKQEGFPWEASAGGSNPILAKFRN